MPQLVVVSGPSGVGKSTIVRLLADRDDRVRLSLSATTRPRREGEVDGVHYRFVTDDEFKDLVSSDAFLEHAVVHGNRYGTLRSETESGSHPIVILEIDVQGARSVKQAQPLAHLVFVLPPNKRALEQRLGARGTEAPEAIEQRLAAAAAEMPESRWFDHTIINDDLDETVGRLRAIIDDLVAV